jgi:hypothetical protein
MALLAVGDSLAMGPTVRRKLGACGEQTHSKERPRS